jgi:Dockerin type I domain/Planctomycete extracellular
MTASSNRRRLYLESLENRSLMAADCHNLISPLDVNDDGSISPTDALEVINRLNLKQSPLLSAEDGYVDVSDDGLVTPIDALKIINHINDPRGTDGANNTEWLRVKGEGESRVGVRMKHSDDGSVGIEVRLQNAASGEQKEILLDDKWIGTIKADARGRGILKIDSSNEFADRMAELLMEGKRAATLAVDSRAQVELINSATDNSARSQENRRLLEGSVFSARLSVEGQNRGEVVFAQHGDREFLGFYARGLTAEQSYDITIGGVVVANARAGSRGVIATRIDVDAIPNFPTIAAGTEVKIANYSGQFVPLRDRLPTKPTVYFANLSGNRLIGSAEIVTSSERTVLGLRLGRVEPNTTFSIFVDDIKIAEATSGRRGFLEYRYNSQRGDSLLAPLPTLTADSVIRVGEVARGKLVKLGG